MLFQPFTSVAGARVNYLNLFLYSYSDTHAEIHREGHEKQATRVKIGLPAYPPGRANQGAGLNLLCDVVGGGQSAASTQPASPRHACCQCMVINLLYVWVIPLVSVLTRLQGSHSARGMWNVYSTREAASADGDIRFVRKAKKNA